MADFQSVAEILDGDPDTVEAHLVVAPDGREDVGLHEVVEGEVVPAGIRDLDDGMESAGPASHGVVPPDDPGAERGYWEPQVSRGFRDSIGRGLEDVAPSPGRPHVPVLLNESYLIWGRLFNSMFHYRRPTFPPPRSCIRRERDLLYWITKKVKK
jgi:hypothetical protein